MRFFFTSSVLAALLPPADALSLRKQLFLKRIGSRVAQNPCEKPCGECDEAFGGLTKPEDKEACGDCKACHEDSEDPSECEEVCGECPIFPKCKACAECSHEEGGAGPHMFLNAQKQNKEAEHPCEKPCGACDKAFGGLDKPEDKEACGKCKACHEDSDDPAACEAPCGACPIYDTCKPCAECSHEEHDGPQMFFNAQKENKEAEHPCEKPCGACDKAFGGLEKPEDKEACGKCKACHEDSDDPAACEAPCGACPIYDTCKPCAECSHEEHDGPQMFINAKKENKEAEHPCEKPCGACDKAFGGLQKPEDKEACGKCKACHEDSDDPAACEAPCGACPIYDTCKPCAECSHQEH